MRVVILLLLAALAGCTEGRVDPFGEYEALRVRTMWCDSELRMARTHADTQAVRRMKPAKYSYECGMLWVADSVAFNRSRQ